MTIDKNGVSSEYRGTHTRFNKRKTEEPEPAPKRKKKLTLDVEAIHNDRRLIVAEFPNHKHSVFDNVVNRDLGFDYSDVPTMPKKSYATWYAQRIPNENWKQILASQQT